MRTPILNTIKVPMITDSIGNSCADLLELRAPRIAQSKLKCMAAEVPHALMIFSNTIAGLLIARLTFSFASPSIDEMTAAWSSSG
jgi:hypothetical protein